MPRREEYYLIVWQSVKWNGYVWQWLSQPFLSRDERDRFIRNNQLSIKAVAKLTVKPKLGK